MEYHKTITLKDGRTCVLRNGTAEDGQALLNLFNLTGFYERYGWVFLCMVQGDGEPEMTRMYIHR